MATHGIWPIERKKLCTNNFKNQEDIKSNYESITNQISFKRWYIRIMLKIKGNFELAAIARLDSGVDQNCI